MLGTGDLAGRADVAEPRTPLSDKAAGLCNACFAAGTSVSMAYGTRAIEALRVGDSVLAEDPVTGKVEPEPVLAVIDDGVKPLLARDLSDGSSLWLTNNHPFWVDGTPRMTGGLVGAPGGKCPATTPPEEPDPYQGESSSLSTRYPDNCIDKREIRAILNQVF